MVSPETAVPSGVIRFRWYMGSTVPAAPGSLPNQLQTALLTQLCKLTMVGSGGIAGVFTNTSTDTTVLISNAGSGPLIKAWAGTIPKFQVDINGTVHTAASYTVGGIDLAEVIPVTDKLEPGDVVEIDPNNMAISGQCSTSGSLAVAGVISTRPGVSLGVTNSDAGEGENIGPQLALAGRIPVKVTDEGGTIQPGDLLIASATPGHARRLPYPLNRVRCWVKPWDVWKVEQEQLKC